MTQSFLFFIYYFQPFGYAPFGLLSYFPINKLAKSMTILSRSMSSPRCMKMRPRDGRRLNAQQTR